VTKWAQIKSEDVAKVSGLIKQLELPGLNLPAPSPTPAKSPG
jgi:hypothetical protein